MPLPPPTAPREPIHTRRIELTGWRRADGLWEVEAYLSDVKTYAFDNAYRGRLEPGDPIHEMRLRVTVDDGFVIREVAASSDATPFAVCPEATRNMGRIVGLRIGPGWMKAVKERIGGAQGCTHHVELLGPIATTLFQTIAPLRFKGTDPDVGGGLGPRDAKDPSRPRLLGSCHAFRPASPVVARLWPEWHDPDSDGQPAPAPAEA